MTRTHTTTPYAREQRIFFAALSLLLIFFGAYVYLVSASIVNVIVRKEINQEITRINSHIGDLEAAYITAQQRVAEESIGEFGFATAPQKKVYIARTSPNVVLVFNDES